MPEFRRMRYTRFCAKERAYTDTLMNCINLVGALVLARITLAHGHHYIAAWILTSALRSVAALALMRWRFSVYSDWRDVMYALLRLSWIMDVIMIRAAVKTPGAADCSNQHLLLSILNFGGITGLALPALGFQLRFRAHCITQALSLLAIVCTNSLACQLVFSATAGPAPHQPSHVRSDLPLVHDLGSCQLGAERLQYLRGLPCEALLFYVQVVFGFVVPSYIVWYCNHKLHEGFERLEAPPPRPAETHSAAQRRRWALSSSQRHGVAAVAFLAFMRGLWELVARFHLQMHLRELGHSWQYPAQAGSYLVDNPTDLLGLLPIVAVVAVRVLAS